MAYKDKENQRERDKRHRERHREKRNAYAKSWRERSNDKVVAYRLAHYKPKKDRRVVVNWLDPKQVRAYNKAYREAHKEEIKAKRKPRVRTESARDKDRVYRQANRERIQAYHRDRYIQHKERLRQLNQACFKKRYAKDKEAIKARNRARYIRDRRKRLEYSRRYRRDNKCKVLSINAKRRALKQTTQVEPIDFTKVLADSNGLCGICGKPFDLFGIDFDHKIPLARGGTHTRENIQATHARCNRAKGAKVG